MEEDKELTLLRERVALFWKDLHSSSLKKQPTEAEPPTRQQEIDKIWKDYKFFYQVLGGLVLVGIGILIGAALFSSPNDRSSYAVNLYTSVLSIIVTVFVIDLLNRRRDEQRDAKLLRERLVREAGSQINAIAIRAIEELRANNWLTGKIKALRAFGVYEAQLQNADLHEAHMEFSFLLFANLENANLHEAHMEYAYMPYANLKRANLNGAYLKYVTLYKANLQDARFYKADLREADLRETKLNQSYLSDADLTSAGLAQADLQAANLFRACLAGANLEDADLQEANLEDADLRGANLKGARLVNAKLVRTGWGDAKLDETTILPDGSRYISELGIKQMSRFTNPTHSEFWQPKPSEDGKLPWWYKQDVETD